MAGMRMFPFLLLTAAGSLVWNTALVLAGATAGASWERILEAMDAYSNEMCIRDRDYGEHPLYAGH